MTGSNDDPMYVVGPELNPTLSDERTALRIGAIAVGDGGWGWEHVLVELPEGHFRVDGTAATPNSTSVDLIFSAFVHAVHVGEGEKATLWTTVHCRSASNATHTIVRWYEIALNGWPTSGTPSIAQWGEIDKSGQSLECYYPSIAVNAEGGMALTWTQSGTGTFMEMWRGLRCEEDTPGTLPDTAMIQDCDAAISFLAPDYCGTTVDPNDPDSFFAHSTIIEQDTPTTQWETWVAKYTLDCGAESGGRSCVADCDRSTGRGTLDVFDFLCFQNSYDTGNRYACDCDTSTGLGACDVFDFLCFQNAYEAGCP